MPLFHTAGCAMGRLAPYKTPLHWVFVDAFPMTPSGKIQKLRLRESFTANQTP